MTNQLVKDILMWGIVLWFVGYVLGIVFFSFVPQSAIGWIIMPIGVLVTLFVLFKKIKNDFFRYYLFLAIGWTLIAIIADYFLLVKVFKPADGYYKLDVYLYYGLTFLLPLIVYWQKRKNT